MNKSKRIIEFTEENLAALPVSPYTTSWWHDKSLHPFVARKGAGGHLYFGYMLTQPERIALAEAKGIKKVGRTVGIGKLPLAEARKIAEETLGNLSSAVMRRKIIPSYAGTASPEAILEPRDMSDNPNYDQLMSVLMDAYSQAANGKGAARHGAGLNFEDQDMMAIMDRVGIGFALGQAIKKATEGNRLDRDKARAEFLGAIVYMAGAIVWLDKTGK